MSLTPIFTGKVNREGRIKVINATRFHNYLKCNFKDRDVQFVVEKLQRKKTSPQNRFFHGVVVPAVTDWAGYNENSNKDLRLVREALKNDFGPKIEVVSMKTGVVQEVPKSIAEYTLDDYKRLIDAVDLYCYDTFGTRLPEPDEVKY